MNKRGITTGFVIVGILIVCTVVLVWFLDNLSKSNRGRIEQSVKIAEERERIKAIVMDCTKKVGYEALYWTSRRGGYLSPKGLTTETGIPYYVIDSKRNMPSKEVLEKEIANFVSQEIFICVNNVKVFQGKKMSSEGISSIVKIEKGEVIIVPRYLIEIRRGNTVSNIDEYDAVRIPVRVREIYDVVNAIIEEQVKDPESICISCFIELANKNNVEIRMEEEGEETIIFTIRDKISPNDTYELIFAIKK